MLSQDVIDFLRGRPIAMLCTRDAKNRPYLHESYLAQTEADHVVVLVAQQFGRMLVENVNDNGTASLLISRAPGDHRSVQVKGRITTLEMPEVRAELFGPLFPLIDAYRMFMTEAGAQEMWSRVSKQRVYRFRFEVAQVFDQTPGPGAGRRISGGGA
jgi:hypothetical protein